MFNGGSSHAVSQGTSNMIGGLSDKLVRSEPWIFRVMAPIRK